MPNESAQLIDGKFQVIKALGGGGMGRVFLCQQIGFDRLVAVKVLRSEWSQDEQSRLRLEREAQALSLLKHRSIVTVYGYGRHNDAQYIAMEHVEGRSLCDLLNSDEPLAVSQTMSIIKQICEALVCAHANGLVHRDVKPSNIIVTADGGAKLIDFGLIKAAPESGLPDQRLTEAGATVGTVLYMSPEQCLGKEIDPRTDIYALGCVMFHCLTGFPPYTADHSVVVMKLHASADALPRLSEVMPNTNFPPALQDVLDRATAKDINARYQSAQDFLADLDRVINNQPVPMALTIVPASRPAHSRLRPILAWAVGCVFAFSAVGAAIFYAEEQRAEQAEAKLRIRADELEKRLREIQEHDRFADNLWELAATRAQIFRLAIKRGNPSKKVEDEARDQLTNAGAATLKKEALKFPMRLKQWVQATRLPHTQQNMFLLHLGRQLVQRALDETDSLIVASVNLSSAGYCLSCVQVPATDEEREYRIRLSVQINEATCHLWHPLRDDLTDAASALGDWTPKDKNRYLAAAAVVFTQIGRYQDYEAAQALLQEMTDHLQAANFDVSSNPYMTEFQRSVLLLHGDIQGTVPLMEQLESQLKDPGLVRHLASTQYLHALLLKQLGAGKEARLKGLQAAETMRAMPGDFKDNANKVKNDVTYYIVHALAKQHNPMALRIFDDRAAVIEDDQGAEAANGFRLKSLDDFYFLDADFLEPIITEAGEQIKNTDLRTNKWHLFVWHRCRARIAEKKGDFRQALSQYRESLAAGKGAQGCSPIEIELTQRRIGELEHILGSPR